MRPPRFTIAGLMVAVVLAAVVLAAYRLGSFVGLCSLVPFGIAALVARSEPGPSVHRRALWAGVIGTLLLPFLAAIAINHALWGYFMTRPAVDRRIVEARRIESVIRVGTVSNPHTHFAFSGLSNEDVDDYLRTSHEEGDYYVLEGRVLRALKHRQLLPARGRGLSPNLLEGLYRALRETGRLEEGEPGYLGAKALSGIVVEALGRDDRPLVFVAVRGREVSNDHYPFYEFLFKSDSPGGPLRLLSSQRFYYDVAGIEGLEWPVFFLAFAFTGLIPTLPVQAFVICRSPRRR